MQQLTIELVMSEFGSSRCNAGGAKLRSKNRLNPTLKSFLEIFPDSRVTLYTDQQLTAVPRVTVVRVDPPFSNGEVRYGWRAHDYYQARGLLDSTADIAIAMDSDMQIVSDGFAVIVEFAMRFGLALPLNPRLLLQVDGTVGVDSTYNASVDTTRGLGLAVNLTPIAFDTRHKAARELLDRYCAKILERPGRGAVHLVQASYELGFQPYVLPPQWCICSPRDLDSPHLWPHAVALHVGHKDVYPRWRREVRTRHWVSALSTLIGRR